jgi:solute carrier family 25 (mitochondrial uncoupling protein), member 8/9
MQSIALEMAKAGKQTQMPSSRTVYSEIFRNEGWSGFYRGIQPNIFRNVCVNVGEMASYDQFKQMFLQYTKMKDDIVLHFICGFMAGFVATVIASPADVVKTRLMSSPDSYSGVVNAFTRMMAEEGPKAFYKGFFPNFMRLSLWSITCFIAMEKIKAAFNKPAEHKQ